MSDAQCLGLCRAKLLSDRKARRRQPLTCRVAVAFSLLAFAECTQPADDGTAMSATSGASRVDHADLGTPGYRASRSDGGMQPTAAGAAVVRGRDAGPEPAPSPAGSLPAGSGGPRTDEPIATGTPDASVPVGADTHCQPTAAGPYVLMEGDSVSVRISCQTGLQMPSALSFDTLPVGATYDPTTATLTWTPTLDQAAEYDLTVRAHPWNETAVVRVVVVDAWNAPNNTHVLDPVHYPEEYGLPVIHVATDPGLNDEEYTPATIVYRGHTYIGSEAKLRGATSASYPKRSYTLKFSKEDKFNEPSLAGGFTKKRKVTLITSFDDNSYLRQRLAFELWNRLDPAHIRVQSYNAVLYLNGEYHGLYTVADHVDGYLMEDFGLFQDGNLYKARTHDANFRATTFETMLPKATPHDGYTKEEGLPADAEPGAYDDLDAFLSWAATSTPEAFARELDSRITRKDYEDWWIFVSFLMADDSIGKNSYHYHDPTLPSSLWRYIPWDLNYSFGQDWRTLRVTAQATRPEGGVYSTMNGLFERILADASFGPALRARYGQALDGPLATDGILGLFDAMAREIDASAARDEQRWQAQYRAYGAWSARVDFTSYQQELQYIRQWILDRHAFLSTLY